MGNFNKYVQEIKDVHGDNFDWDLFNINKFNQKIPTEKEKSNVFTLKKILHKNNGRLNKMELSLKEMDEYEKFEDYYDFENNEYYKLYEKLNNTSRFTFFKKCGYSLIEDPMFYIYENNKMTSSNKIILMMSNHTTGSHRIVNLFGLAHKLFIIEKSNESGKDKEYDIIEADKNCEYYMIPTPNKNYPIIKKIYIEDLNNYKGNTIHFTINYKGLIDYSFDVSNIKFNSENKTILFKNKPINSIKIEDLNGWSDFRRYLKIKKDSNIKISIKHSNRKLKDEIFIDDKYYKIEPLIKKIKKVCNISTLPTIEDIKKLLNYYKENKIQREPHISEDINLIAELIGDYLVDNTYELI